MDRLVPILYYFPYQFFLNHCWFWFDNVYQNYFFGCLRKKHIETDLKKQRGKLISSLTWHGWTQIIFSNLPHSLSWPAFLWLASFSSKFFWQQDNIFRSSGIYFTSLTISVGRQRCCSNNLTQIQGLPINALIWASHSVQGAVVFSLVDESYSHPWIQKWGLALSEWTKTGVRRFPKENWADLSRW